MPSVPTARQARESRRLPRTTAAPPRGGARLGWLLGMILAGLAGPVPAASPATPPAPAETGWLERVARQLSPRLRRLAAERAEVARRLEQARSGLGGQTTEAIGFHSQLSSRPDAVKWVEVDFGVEVDLDTIALVPAHVAEGGRPGGGYGFPLRYRVELLDGDPGAVPRLIFDGTREDQPLPGDSPVVFDVRGARGRVVRLTATRLSPCAESYGLALGELIALSGEQDLAAGRPVRVSDQIHTPPQWAPEHLVDGQSVLGLPVGPDPSPANGYHSVEQETRPDAVKWVEVDLGREVSISEVRLIPARPRDWAAISGFGFPRRFQVTAWRDGDATGPVVLRPEDDGDFRNPGGNAVLIPGAGCRARKVRVTATRLWSRGDYHAFALAELQVISGLTNVALGASVTAFDSVEYGRWSTNALVDGFSSQHRLVPVSGWLRALGEGPALTAAARRLAAEQAALTRDVLAGAARWLGGGLLVLLVGAAAFAYRMRLLRALELERLRTRIATDLHDELGTRLTRIGLTAELAGRQTDPAHPAHPPVTQISAMAREMVRTMDEIVWAVNPRNDTLDDLATYVLHFAGEFFRDTPVRCDLDVPADLPAVPLRTEVRHHLFLAVKEALNNLLKHAGARTARVRFEYVAPLLVIEVTDDGRGLPPEGGRRPGQGLRNLEQRMAAIGGRVRISSEPGRGTTVRFEVRLGRFRTGR